jgi:hypothetical protein
MFLNLIHKKHFLKYNNLILFQVYQINESLKTAENFNYQRRQLNKNLKTIKILKIRYFLLIKSYY